MLKLVKASLLALAGLGMASAIAQSPGQYKATAQMGYHAGNIGGVYITNGNGNPIANINQTANGNVIRYTTAAPSGSFSTGPTGGSWYQPIKRAPNGSVILEAVVPSPVPGKTNQAVPIKIAQSVPSKSIAKALVRSVPFVGNVYALGELLEDLGTHYGYNGSGWIFSDPANQPSYPVSDGYFWRADANPSTHSNTKAGACTLYLNIMNPKPTFIGVTGNYCSYRRSDGYQWNVQLYQWGSNGCPSGWYITPSGCLQTVPASSTSVTPDDVEQMLQNVTAWPNSVISALDEALATSQGAFEFAQNLSEAGNPSVSFPGDLPLFETNPEIVSTKQWINETGDPITETTTQKTTGTASGNQITYNTVNTTTTTNNTTNQVRVSTTTAPQNTTEPQPVELEVCGLPGGPACKIDEEGTPEPVENDAQESIDDLFRPLTECMNDPMSCLPELPDINWSFSFPSSCGSINLAAFAPFITSIDICQYQGMFHDIMSMLWAAAGVFGAIAIVGGASRQE